MPDIVVCFKWVVDEAYIRRTSSGALDFSSVDYKISEYDRNAIEAAVRLRDEYGGSVTAVTVGVPEAAKGVKDALSRGPDQAIFIADPSFRDLDAFQTAEMIGEVLRAKTHFQIILCGEGSGDVYAQQVGPRLAEVLGIPCAAYVQKLSIEGNRIIVERKAEDFTEVLSIPLPALVTVLPDIGTPRIPGVRDTLMASKKPVETVGRNGLNQIPEALLQTVALEASRMERECEKFTAETADISRFAGTLFRKGVLKQGG
jgi:electron transfer flavoprotein beta subunit